MRLVSGILTALLLTFAGQRPAHPQSFTIAKMSLGMSDSLVKATLGNGYRYTPEVSATGDIKLFAAVSNTDAYSFAFVDGNLAFFSYTRIFTRPNEPQRNDLIADVNSRLWQPWSDGRGGLWVSTATGRPATTPQDFSNTSELASKACLRVEGQPYGGKYAGENTLLTGELMRPRLVDTGAECGVTIGMTTYNEDATENDVVTRVSIVVRDNRPFHQLVSNARTEQQR
jgi:hypothetical protein